MGLSIVINTRNRKIMLFDLLKSIEKQIVNFKYEIIVVDDCSDLDYSLEINSKFKSVIFIRNQSREYLIKSRNKGWRASNNENILFIDDDNEIFDLNLLQKGFDALNNYCGIGVLGCRTYYYDEREKILLGPNSFNKYLGKVGFKMLNDRDNNFLDGHVDTFDNPNAFFTRKFLLKKIGGFSDDIVQTYSEADYCENVRYLCYRVVQDSNLKVYHKSPKVDFKNLPIRLLGGSPERFYYLMRNRFLLIRKHGNLAQVLFFGLISSWFYNFYYILISIKNRKKDFVKSGLWGIVHGYIILFTGVLPKVRY